ncbi:MAG: Clp protease ClpP [Eubacterium sp.]|nr:Clp protease ClpP [Eubacterium sp.]
MKTYYNLCVDKESGEANIYIFGDITSWDYREKDVSSYSLAKELESLSEDVKKINVYINSRGGDVAESLAIRSQLKRHQAKICTYADGVVASAAVNIFMAGDERVMANASLLFIHNAWTSGSGDANAFRKQAEDLDKYTEQSIRTYMEHLTISEEELKQLMDQETFLDPEQCLDMGFCTFVEGQSKPKSTSQNAKKVIYEKLLNANEKVAPVQQPKPGKDEDEGLSPMLKILKNI